MKKKISQYHTHYLKALMLALRPNEEDNRLAVEELNKAIAIKDDVKVRRLQMEIGKKTQDFEMLQEAALSLIKLGEVEGYSELGRVYRIHHANNHLYDEKKAFEAFKEGAAKGSYESKFHLASCYSLGIGVEENHEKAKELYLEAIKCDNRALKGASYFELAETYLLEDNYKEALKYFKKALKEGDREAAFQIAEFYLNGWGVKKNLDKYMEYLTMDFNHKSNFALGGVYLQGDIAPADDDLAKWHLHNSARQGSIHGALMYALLLDEKGEDEMEVNYWLEMAIGNASNIEEIHMLYADIEMMIDVKTRQKIEKLVEQYWQRIGHSA